MALPVSSVSYLVRSQVPYKVLEGATAKPSVASEHLTFAQKTTRRTTRLLRMYSEAVKFWGSAAEMSGYLVTQKLPLDSQPVLAVRNTLKKIFLLVEVWKGFRNRRPQTLCRLSTEGKERFLAYLAELEKVVRDSAAVRKSNEKKQSDLSEDIPKDWILA